MAKTCRATFTGAKGGAGGWKAAITGVGVSWGALVVAALLFATASPVPAVASQLSAGPYHGVALHNDGTAWTWGFNRYGQLGNGTTETSPTPARVQGLTGLVAVAAGEGFTLALKDDGTVWSWGDNSSGQLGNGSTTASATPVQVSGLHGVVAIAAGWWHAVALKSDGTVWTWGANNSGQLGNGDIWPATSPVQVVGLSKAVAIAGGAQHTVAVRSDGTVWSWGGNSVGQLGDDSRIDRRTPVIAIGIAGVVDVAAGETHTVALKGDGTVWTWGLGSNGELGTGQYLSLTPARTVGLPAAAVAIAAAGSHSVAVLDDSTVWSWGRSYSPLLDYNGRGDNMFPVKVSVFPFAKRYPVTAVPLWTDTRINLTPSDTVSISNATGTWDWGGGPVGPDGSIFSTDTWITSGRLGELIGYIGPVAFPNYNHSFIPQNDPALFQVGSGSVVLTGKTGKLWLGMNDGYFTYATGDNSGSVEVDVVVSSGPEPPATSKLVAVAAAPTYMMVMDKNGAVRAWGGNEYGQLGIGSFSYSTVPAQVPGLFMVSAVAPSLGYNLALKQDGTVWSWGVTNGFWGDENVRFSYLPVQVAGLPAAAKIAAGETHSLALSYDGTVWAWGRNVYGQLGNGSTSSYSDPAPVSDLTGATAIAAGRDFSIALKSDGTVWAWGDNTFGQLGRVQNWGSSVPLQIPTLSGVAAIAAFYDHALALKQDGTVWAWGRYFGTITPVPVQVPGLFNVTAIAAGLSHYLALKQDGTLWAWGENASGQLGDGTTIAKSTPVQVLLQGGVAKIDAGWEFNGLLSADGTAWSWGVNVDGQLGSGDTVGRLYPQQVLQLSGVTEIRTGYYHTIAVKADGTVWAWGSNAAAQLGTDPGWLPATPLVALGTTELTLTAATVGTGAGSVRYDPAGITCSSALCSSRYPYGTRITLHPISSGGSFFAGWSGACSGTGDCLLSMTSDKTAYANFALTYPVRIGTTPYSSVAAGYLAATGGALVKSVAGDLFGGLTADRSLAVKLSGGYNNSFSSRSGAPTRLRGKLLVRRGTVRVDRIKVI